jgi:nitrite reductase/ring-hydroxylating ferredoxin subunit
VAYVKAAAASALKPGWVIEARVGEETFAILHAGGEIRAFEGSCPCTGGPLGQGAIREGLLVCPWHGWRFDCATGVSAYHPSIRIRRVPVRIDGDDILIETD